MVTRILILAAGQASRMRGGDKAAENIAGEPALRRIARQALSLGLPVHVALPALPHPRADLLAGLDTRLLAVPESAEGMSGTLRGAVARLPVFDRLLVLLSDLPDLETPDLQAVLEAPGWAPEALIWRGSTQAGAPGHPILFDGALRPEFAALSGDDGGAGIVRRHSDRICLVPLSGDRARRDLDTPEDWAAWRAEKARS